MNKTIIVKGMSCAHCAGRVKEELEAISGVVSADVSADAGKAIIEHEEEIDYGLFKDAVEKAGYTFVEIHE
ncbi:MAG: heavy-metal-associated domain-containing protein [Bacillota bacterium]